MYVCMHVYVCTQQSDYSEMECSSLCMHYYMLNMYACMQVCVKITRQCDYSAHKYVCMYVCMYNVCMHEYSTMCIYVCMHVCMCEYVCMYVCMYV